MYIPVVAFWSSLFKISEIIELGHTVFIVLRKQALIFLHWYHHITVLVYTWYGYTVRTSSGRWYLAMNYAVHSVMYSYYAMRALKYRAPKWVRMGITIFQLSQMVVGVTIGVYVYKLKQANIPCGVSDNSFKHSFIMYLSYLFLFAKFFYDAYISPPKQATSSKSMQDSEHVKELMNSRASRPASKQGHITSDGKFRTDGSMNERNGYYLRKRS